MGQLEYEEGAVVLSMKFRRDLAYMSVQLPELINIFRGNHHLMGIRPSVVRYAHRFKPDHSIASGSIAAITAKGPFTRGPIRTGIESFHRLDGKPVRHPDTPDKSRLPKGVEGIRPRQPDAELAGFRPEPMGGFELKSLVLRHPLIIKEFIESC
jgi:hypothetical protein